jgi:hypothetical protein
LPREPQDRATGAPERGGRQRRNIASVPFSRPTTAGRSTWPGARAPRGIRQARKAAGGRSRRLAMRIAPKPRDRASSHW